MPIATQVQHTSADDVLKGFSLPDFSEVQQQVESVQTVKFAFHAWKELPNFGSDGFRFNIQYATLDRLSPIYLPVFPRPKIIPRSAGQFALMGATLTEAVPSLGSRPQIVTELQMPSESVDCLRTGYGKFGMVELVSLAAHDRDELARNIVVFYAVMAEAEDAADEDAGRRPSKRSRGEKQEDGDLLLEEFPDWLKNDAKRALHASQDGIVLNGRKYKLSTEQVAQGELLIEEIKGSIAQAEEAALNPSDGILSRTKELLNITANKGVGGKTHLDGLDEWLLKQYPSFKMDTDVERAQKAMQSAMEAGNKGNNDLQTGVLALLQQNQEMIAAQQRQMALLTEAVLNQKETKAKGKAPEA